VTNKNESSAVVESDAFDNRIDCYRNHASRIFLGIDRVRGTVSGELLNGELSEFCTKLNAFREDGAGTESDAGGVVSMLLSETFAHHARGGGLDVRAFCKVVEFYSMVMESNQ